MIYTHIRTHTCTYLSIYLSIYMCMYIYIMFFFCLGGHRGATQLQESSGCPRNSTRKAKCKKGSGPQWSLRLKKATGDTCHPRNSLRTAQCNNLVSGANMGSFSFRQVSHATPFLPAACASAIDVCPSCSICLFDRLDQDNYSGTKPN